MCIVASRLGAGGRSGPDGDYWRARGITDTNGQPSHPIKSMFGQQATGGFNARDTVLRMSKFRRPCSAKCASTERGADLAATTNPHPFRDEGRRRRLTMPGWLTRTSRLERKAAHAFRLKNYRAAIRPLKELLEHVGENPNTLHVLGLCHERLGADEAAFEYATRAISVDAEHFEALRLLIRLHERQGRHAAALALVQRALACLPSPVEPRGLGRFIRLVSRDDDASLAGYDRELREWIRWARGFLVRNSDMQRGGVG